MFDVVQVGHLSIDSIFLPNRKTPFNVLGGSVAYSSFAARRLSATVSIISKVGSDFPKAYLWWLEQEGINLSVVEAESAQTTRFELKYNNRLSSRKLRLKSKAPSITVEDVPKSLKAKIVHVAPIVGEITYGVVEKLKSCAKWLSLDPQGLVRNLDEKGNVTRDSITNKRIIELIDIYKSSLNEIKATTGMSNLKSGIKAVHDYGVKTVIVTLGMKGAVLSVEGTIYRIPACKPEKFVDPTGAGDVFIGGFLAEYIRGESLLWCACVGSAAASLVVEAAGPTFFGNKLEIYRRAQVIHEKEIKQ